jgi:hypothetical protein
MRQPATYYPTFFGTGIGTSATRFPDNEAIVIGNHSDASGPNNANYSVAIGYYAAQMNQKVNGIAIGTMAGYFTQGSGAVAFGTSAGYSGQGCNAIAMGIDSGYEAQGSGAIAIGYQSASASQGIDAIVIGTQSASVGQGTTAISIGKQSGTCGQGSFSIAIGYQCGVISQGNNSIAIGYQAGYTATAAISIVINASNTPVNTTINNSFNVSPVRNLNGTSASRMYYNNVTNEITYGTDSSSIKYKTNISDISQEKMDAIFSLRPVEFDFIDGGKHAVGFIAEEVDSHIPEVVVKNPSDTSIIEGLDYQHLVSPLVAIIQDYRKQIQDLQARVSILENL